MDDRAARRRLETQMEAFLSSGMAQHEADELFRLVAELCPDRLDFREVCENLYDGIHITDGEGKVLFINTAYTRTTGIRPEDVLGRRVSDIEAEGKLYRGSVTAQVLERRSTRWLPSWGSTRRFWSPAPRCSVSTAPSKWW